jgi:hypothetical protein
MENPQGASIATWNHNTLVLNISYQMVQADANGDKKRYWHYFIWFMRELTAYFTDAERILYEEDMRILEDAIIQITREEKSDESRKAAILNVQESFANAHVALGFAAFSKCGIIYLSEEGEIDFKKIGMKEIQRIVQAPYNQEGLIKLTDKVIQKRNAEAADV